MTRFMTVHLRAMENGRWSGGYLNSFSLSTATPLEEAMNNLKKAWHCAGNGFKSHLVDFLSVRYNTALDKHNFNNCRTLVFVTHA
jgi:hypothetical protein